MVFEIYARISHKLCSSDMNFNAIGDMALSYLSNSSPILKI